MTIAIRADGNRTIGIGHLARCIALAHALRAQGAEVVFVARDLGFDAKAFVEARGFPLRQLPAPGVAFIPAPGEPPHAAWAQMNGAQDAGETADALADFDISHLVIDHYGYDAVWHEVARENLHIPIAAIDDLADRPMAVELIVDHNWHPDHAAKYASVAGSDTRFCGGPDYALLSPAYEDAQRWSEGASEGIGLFLGGGDLMGLTPLYLDHLRASGYAGPVEIVTTSAASNLDELRVRDTADPAFTLSLDLPDLSAFYARRKVQIGAGGGASWERCCIGSPSVVTSTAANQAVVLDALDAKGAAISVARDDAVAAALALLDDSGRRRALSETARKLVDGRGASRAAEAVLAL